MHPNVIREALHNQPFKPFKLKLADQRELLVKHPDFVLIPPTNRQVIVVHENDAVSLLEPLRIVSLEFAAPSSTSSS